MWWASEGGCKAGAGRQGEGSAGFQKGEVEPERPRTESKGAAAVGSREKGAVQTARVSHPALGKPCFKPFNLGLKTPPEKGF